MPLDGAIAESVLVDSDDEDSLSWDDHDQNNDSDWLLARDQLDLFSVRKPTTSCLKRRFVCVALTFVVMLCCCAILIIAILALSPTISTKHNSRPNLLSTLDNPRNLSACADFPWKEIRLPKTLVPLGYELKLHPNLTTFTFDGHVTIHIKVVESTDLVVIHSKSLLITDYTLKIDKKEVKPKLFEECDELELLAFVLDKRIHDGSTIDLIIKYEGNITDDLLGLYRNTFQGKDHVSYSAVSHFEPTDARRMFPSFDEPDMKAVFDISIIRQSDHMTLSNMELVESRPITGGLVLDKFARTLRMSTYLVAVFIGNFVSITQRTNTGTKVSIYAPPEQIGDAKYALDTAVKGLQHLEEFFNISFPLKKEDLIALSDFSAGAMENWGLITFRDSLLLFNEQKSSVRSQEYVATVVSHELAHQWFGNLVTMKWWNDLWLNEGFASFIEYVITDKIHPDWHILDNFYIENVAAGLFLDGMVSSHPISVPVADPAEIASIFDAISYQKGASIINMFMTLAGEDRFAAGLQDYLNTYRYSNADGDDLWTVIEKHIDSMDGVRLKEVAKDWTTQVGYPFVKVEMTQHGSSVVVLNQRRFVYLCSERDSEQMQEVWPIPLTYKSNIDHNLNRKWMKSNSSITIKFDSKPDWVFLNVGGTGFVRILYSPTMYQSLQQQLTKDHNVLSATDRASLLYDSFSFLKAGLLDVPTVFDLIHYLSTSEEDDRAPWRVISGQLIYIDELLFESDYRGVFREFFRSIVSPVYRRIGWNPLDGHRQQLFQTEILSLACTLEIQDCLKRAKDQFKKWRQNENSISPELKSLVVSTGVKFGNDSVWQLVHNRYTQTQLPTEKGIYLRAMSSSRNPWLLNKLLRLNLDSHVIKPNLVPRVIGNVADNPIGRPLAWRFLRAKWVQLTELLGPTSLIGSMVKATINDFYTDFEYNEVKNFFMDKDLGKSAKRLVQAMEGIQINIQWLKLNQKPLENWLQQWKARKEE